MGVASINLAYAVESQVGKRPTSGYIIMPEVIEMSGFNPENPLEKKFMF